MQKDITERGLQKSCSFNLIKSYSEKQESREKNEAELKKNSMQQLVLILPT